MKRALPLRALAVAAVIIVVVACGTEAPSNLASLASAVIDGSGVQPALQGIDEGSTASWTGSVALVDTVDGDPNYLAWDFDGNGTDEQILCDEDGGTTSVPSCQGTHCGFTSGSFSAATSFTTGFDPRAVVKGDFNRDGKLDLAIANEAAFTVSILLGTGTGSFGLKTDFATTGRPSEIATGDLNADGNADLVTANGIDGTVSVLLGTGSGSFGAPAGLTAGSFPSSVSIVDLNANGVLDLVVTNGGSDSASVFLGTGAGSFGAKTDFVTGDAPSDGAVGDVNRDGRLDLVTANTNANTLSVLLGTGTGSFGAKTDFATGIIPVFVAIGDFDGNGNPDVAVADFSSASVSIHLGTGTGSFGPKTDYPTVNNPAWIAIDDFTGDGKLDLAVSHSSVSSVAIFSGKGNGAFNPAVNFATGANPVAVTTGDFNADGKPDLVTSNFGPDTISVLLGSGAAPLATANLGAKTDFATGTSPRGIALGDVNADGKPDLAVANIFSDAVSILLGTGSGSFGAATNFTTGVNPYAVAIGDLNADGRPDLAVANNASSSVSVLLGTGAGSFGAKTDFAVAAGPVSLAIADFNRDGKLDLAVTASTANVVSILLGTGTGTFGAKTDFVAGGAPFSVAVGDVNRDGAQDLALANLTGNTVSILLGNGAGSFGAKTDFATGTAPFSVALADLNADGALDIAVSNNSVSSISVLLGTGTGSFGAKTDFAAGSGAAALALGDVNRDGKLDLAVTNANTTTASILLGTGTGSFGAKTDFTTGSTPIAIALGDVNGDGKLDLAVANQASSTASILLGTRPGEARNWSCPADENQYYDDSKGTGFGPFFKWSAELSVGTTTSPVFTIVRDVSVFNVEPFLVDVTAVSPVAEGNLTTVEVTWLDPGFNDAFAVTIEWGDGTPDSILAVPAGTFVGNAVHLFPDDGNYVVTAYVQDDEGSGLGNPGQDSVSVLDIAPVITSVITNAPVAAGSAATVWVNVQSSQGDSVVYDFDWDGNGTFGDVGDVIGSSSNVSSFVQVSPAFVTVNVQARDDDGNIAIGQVDVEWTAAGGGGNNPPIAADDTIGPTNEDTPLTVSVASLLANDTDPDGAGDPRIFSAASHGENGSVVVVGGNLTYTPDANANGADTFTYTVHDAAGASSTATVSVTVSAQNDAPIPVPDAFATLENAQIAIAGASLRANDTDPEGTALTVTAVGSPVNGAVMLVAGNAIFSPNGFFNGAASFSYTVSDGALTANATVTVDVLPVNQAPGMPALSSPLPGSTVGTLTPSLTVINATDIDAGAVLTYQFQVDTSAAFGSATLQDSGPMAEGIGNTAFTTATLFENTAYSWRVRTSDGSLTSDWTAPATFFVDTNNQPPTAPLVVGPAGDALLQGEQPALTVENATDPESNVLSYTFEIHEGTAAGPIVFTESGIDEGSDGRTTWTATGPLNRGSTYVWFARATDSFGAIGPPSAEATFTIYDDPPTKSSGCGCDLASANPSALPPAGPVAAMIALVLVAWRRRLM